MGRQRAYPHQTPLILLLLLVPIKVWGPPPKSNDSQLLGNSPRMVQIRHYIDRFAPTNASVLLLGNTGTGKDVAARELHKKSARAGKPFQVIDLGAINPDLLESELFGHEKGAFTGATELRKGLLEAANGGTIYLDGLQEIDPRVQTRLLRFLEDKKIRRVGGTEEIPIDVRVIASINGDPQFLIQEGKLREDLYQRLKVGEIHMPSLKEIPEDIPLLFESVRARVAPRVPKLSTAEEEALLKAHPWNGNMRELENIVRRLDIDQHEANPPPLVDSIRNTLGNTTASAAEFPQTIPIRPTTAESRLYALGCELALSRIRSARGDRQLAAKRLGVPVEQLDEIERAAKAGRKPSRK